jgi:superfamily I DNA/RNA helicase
MQQTEQAQGTQEPRRLFPNHRAIVQLAREVNPDDPLCERAMRNLLDELAVPYVKVGGVRLYDRDEVRAAILAREVNRQPRRPGRPKKAA